MRRLWTAMIVSTLASAAMAAAPDVLARLSPGQWTVHEIGNTASARSICIRSADQLVQLHHPGQKCARFVIDSSPARTTIHYTCPGTGYGRTTVTSDSDGVARLETQGLAGGQPFAVDYEARRTGPCAR